MSQSSIRSQRNIQWQSQSLITYDCPICMTTNTRQLLQLPCGHNLCLSCLHMICAHSSLSCPFCRRRISTWLRHNPDYSKLIIQRESESTIEQKVIVKKPKRRYRTSKPKPTIDEQGNVNKDWLLARKIHYEQLEEFRYTYGRVTRSMAKNMTT